jgi:hypothetical protein
VPSGGNIWSVLRPEPQPPPRNTAVGPLREAHARERVAHARERVAITREYWATL